MSIIVMTDDDFEKNMQRLADQFHPLLAASFRARDTGQREALAQLQAEMPDLRANMTKALDLLQVLTSTKYTDRAFVKAVDEADEMLEQLRGKVVLKGLADQQEAQEVGPLKGEFAEAAEQAFREQYGLQEAQGEPVAWQWRSRIKGGAWDARENGRYDFEPAPFMDVEHRGLYAAPPAAAHGDEAVRKDAERYRWLMRQLAFVRNESDEKGTRLFSLVFKFPAEEWRDCVADIKAAAMRAQGDGGADHA